MLIRYSKKKKEFATIWSLSVEVISKPKEMGEILQHTTARSLFKEKIQQNWMQNKNSPYHIIIY